MKFIEPEQSIREMFNTLPKPRDAELAMLIASFKRDTARFAPEIVMQACGRFRTGKAGDGKRAPLLPAFVSECEKVADLEKIIAFRERQKQEAVRPRGPSPYEVIQEQERVRMAGRPILAQNVSADEFRKQCRAMKWPVNSEWLRGTVYGPMEQM